ncbi:SAM-dependent methyltransferase [Salisediminibacterium halotolerans]|uniref:SAM-dependent methyltransferase, MidA family n=1 Tax=Salisediminibacterium halotolerans TaxID=517425 RepID=A0A1H9SC56_9BACI|nr:SAM-dependent methyltransferase [Salisediminibacterium haloalkalitolerans]SER82155.1 SAM-dependent methyltransferase, MidA family [Salisediminibacterium haloalkalitolerans]
MCSVAEQLRKRGNGPWDMATFMETALYDLSAGYYQSEKIKLGKDGDFYTSNHVHPVFGQTFARFFADVISSEQLPPVITELGAGEGRFSLSVLDYFAEFHPEIYESCYMILIEQSGDHRQRIEAALAGHKGKFDIYQSISEAVKANPELEGIIFSNEFFDALPVHQVERHAEKWYEVFVEDQNDKLAERVFKCGNDRLLQWLAQFGPDIPDGFRTEASPLMEARLKQLASWLKGGILVTADYGYRDEELKRPERKEGSLRGYRNHELVHNPLESPGEMDLTHHIHWDAYDKAAELNGLETIIHERQDQFLLKAGLFSFLQTPDTIDPFSDVFKLNRAIQSFVQPGGISSAFQVDVKGKNLANTVHYRYFNEDPYRIK